MGKNCLSSTKYTKPSLWNFLWNCRSFLQKGCNGWQWGGVSRASLLQDWQHSQQLPQGEPRPLEWWHRGWVKDISTEQKLALTFLPNSSIRKNPSWNWRWASTPQVLILPTKLTRASQKICLSFRSKMLHPLLHVKRSLNLRMSKASYFCGKRTRFVLTSGGD